MPGKFSEAWNKRDAAELAGLFAADAEFINVVGLWWHNRQDIYKAHEYGLRVIFSNSDLSVGRLEERRLSDDHSIVHARMRLKGQSSHPNSVHPGNRNTVFTFVLEKTDKGWHCVSAQNTDIVPGKETNLVDNSGNLKAVDYRTKKG